MFIAGRENGKIPYVHCSNHQLYLVLVMSVEQAINECLHVCGSLNIFFLKPAVAFYYNGEKWKRLLEQW